MDIEHVPSRNIVKLLSWVGLVLGVLSVLEGIVLGVAQILLSVVGLYATWSDVLRRDTAIAVYALGWAGWALMETLYFFCLLASSSKLVSSFLTNVISSRTFPNLAPAIQSLFDGLARNLNGFVIFAAITRIAFDWLCAYYGIALWKYVLSHDTRLPLLQSHVASRPARPSLEDSFSSRRVVQHPQQPPRARIIPFQGKGFRLGEE